MACKLIDGNPYRCLGVFSNSPGKTVLGNYNRLVAFANVGKTAELPSDTGAVGVGSVSRSKGDVESAKAAIQLPKDRMAHALFWFLDASPVDGVAFNNLASGDRAKALEIWKRQDTFSTRVNRATMYLQNGNQRLMAVQMMWSVLGNAKMRGEFVAAVCGEGVSFSAEELLQLYLERLSGEVGAQRLLAIGEKAGLPSGSLQFLVDSCLSEPVGRLEVAIESARSVSGGAVAHYRAGNTLIEVAGECLGQIEGVVGASDARYRRLADKAASAILQCSIGYFNDTNDTEVQAVDKAMKMAQAALAFAVGDVVRGKIKHNVEILEKKKTEAAYGEDLKAVAIALKKSVECGASTYNVQCLLSETESALKRLKTAPSMRDLYQQMSSTVANRAINTLVQVVNNAMDAVDVEGVSSFQSICTQIESFVNKANHVKSIFTQVGKLDMVSKVRSYYDKSVAQLDNLIFQHQQDLAKFRVLANLEGRPPIPPPKTSSSSGCMVTVLAAIGSIVASISILSVAFFVIGAL